MQALIPSADLHNAIFLPNVHIILYTTPVMFALSGTRVPWSTLSYYLSFPMVTYVMPIAPHEFPGGGANVLAGSIRARAVLSLLQGTVTTFVTLFLYYGMRNWGLPKSSVILSGWLTYLIFYFFWLSLLRLAFAAFLLFGFELKPPSETAFFAVNPWERWRRWNVYLYDWMLNNVFLPVSRKTGSLALGIFAVFLLDFFFHNSHRINLMFYGGRHPSMNGALVTEVLFYTFHASAILLAVKTRRFWPSGDTLSGWFGVAATHFLMALVHTLGTL